MIIECNYCGKPVDVRKLSCGSKECNAAMLKDQEARDTAPLNEENAMTRLQTLIDEVQKRADTEKQKIDASIVSRVVRCTLDILGEWKLKNLWNLNPKK